MVCRLQKLSWLFRDAVFIIYLLIFKLLRFSLIQSVWHPETQFSVLYHHFALNLTRNIRQRNQYGSIVSQ